MKGRNERWRAEVIEDGKDLKRRKGRADIWCG